MNGLLEYQLSKEDEGIRRLVWILQVKQPCIENSKIREWFNLKRNKQIAILKGDGYSYTNICDKAKKYRCALEMFY